MDMRKSFLIAAVVAGIASAPSAGFAANNAQQRIDDGVAVGDETAGVVADITFFTSSPGSARLAARSGCSAISAKDVAANKSWRDRCE